MPVMRPAVNVLRYGPQQCPSGSAYSGLLTGNAVCVLVDVRCVLVATAAAFLAYTIDHPNGRMRVLTAGDGC